MRRTIPFLMSVAVAASACAPAGGAPSPERAPLQALRHSIDSLVNDSKFANAHLGVLIINPASGDTLYSRNAGKMFMPASNQKLLTGSVALTQLGPDFRFTTDVHADGAVTNGDLQGSLVVHGTGDPSMSEAMAKDAMVPLRAMADSVHARGIRRIAHGLRAGTDAFPDAAWGFGWSWDDLDAPYSAGVDELYLNEGFLEVDVWGASGEGQAPRFRVRPIGAEQLAALPMRVPALLDRCGIEGLRQFGHAGARLAMLRCSGNILPVAQRWGGAERRRGGGAPPPAAPVPLPTGFQPAGRIINSTARAFRRSANRE